MTDRTYAAIRLTKGDYLQVTNDRRMVFRITSYYEDGSLVVTGRNGREYTTHGLRWRAWQPDESIIRRDGDGRVLGLEPTKPGADGDEWDEDTLDSWQWWECVADVQRSKAEAIATAFEVHDRAVAK